MRNYLPAIILVLVLVGGISGCAEPVKEAPKDPVPEVKLFELLPKHSEKLPTAIDFKIITYKIPLSKYSEMCEAFDALGKEKMQFSNSSSFKVNGFEAGVGNVDSWPTITECLRKSEAKRVKISSLIAYEMESEYNIGNDHIIGTVPSDTQVSYFNLSLNEKKVVLSPGVLGWRIKAGEVGQRRGLVQVILQGIFKRDYHKTLPKLQKFENGEAIFRPGEIVFKPSSMVMTLNEGEFVLIGARCDYFDTGGDLASEAVEKLSGANEMRLGELFFRTRGSIVIPKKDKEGKPMTENGKILYEHFNDIDMAEVYLIANMGVRG